MKNRFALFTALITLVLPAAALAAPSRPGPYLSAFTGITLPADITVPGTDFVTKANFNDRVAFDPGYNIGGSGGYDFGLLRLEGELSYKQSEIKSITDQSGLNYRAITGYLGAFSVMFNSFVDLHNSSSVTPYLGGGIGFADLYLSDTRGTNPITSTKTLLYGEADKTIFAYQFGAGVGIALNHQVSLDIGYRYFATEQADFDSSKDIATSMKLESHNATIGVRFKF